MVANDAENCLQHTHTYIHTYILFDGWAGDIARVIQPYCLKVGGHANVPCALVRKVAVVLLLCRVAKDTSASKLSQNCRVTLNLNSVLGNQHQALHYTLNYLQAHMMSKALSIMEHNIGCTWQLSDTLTSNCKDLMQICRTMAASMPQLCLYCADVPTPPTPSGLYLSTSLSILKV